MVRAPALTAMRKRPSDRHPECRDAMVRLCATAEVNEKYIGAKYQHGEEVHAPQTEPAVAQPVRNFAEPLRIDPWLAVKGKGIRVGAQEVMGGEEKARVGQMPPNVRIADEFRGADDGTTQCEAKQDQEGRIEQMPAEEQSGDASHVAGMLRGHAERTGVLLQAGTHSTTIAAPRRAMPGKPLSPNPIS